SLLAVSLPALLKLLDGLLLLLLGEQAFRQRRELWQPRRIGPRAACKHQSNHAREQYGPGRGAGQGPVRSNLIIGTAMNHAFQFNRFRKSSPVRWCRLD